MTTTEYRQSAHKAGMQKILVTPAMKDALSTLRLSTEPKEDPTIPPWHPGYERWASHKHSWMIGYHAALEELEKLATDLRNDELPLEVTRPYQVQAMNQLLKDAPPEIREQLRQQMEKSIREGTRTPCQVNQP